MNIRAWREAKGLSQKQLAVYMGVSQAIVCNWEKDGKRVPKRQNMKKLAAIFGTTVDNLQNGLPTESDEARIEVVEVRRPENETPEQAKVRLLQEQICEDVKGMNENELKHLRSFIAGLKAF